MTFFVNYGMFFIDEIVEEGAVILHKALQIEHTLRDRSDPLAPWTTTYMNDTGSLEME